MLFLNAVLFLLGVYFYAASRYELLNMQNSFLSIFLIMLGGGFLVLFIDSPKEFSFLLSSLILLLFGYFSFSLTGSFFLFRYATQLGLLLIDALPLILILAGIIILLNQREKRPLRKSL